MSNIDARVASILDRPQNDDSDDEDALIASLEEDSTSPSIDAFREQRLQQLHSEYTRAKQQRSAGFGSYTVVKDEKEVMDMTTSVERAVVHFAKEGFARCTTMDAELEKLAPKHTDTRFLKISVDDAPFLVTKLNIKVLPCVLAFVSGKSVDRIIGFEGLGYTQESFTTQDLEARLLGSGVVLRAKGSLNENFAGKAGRGGVGGIRFGVKKATKEDSDDDEWD